MSDKITAVIPAAGYSSRMKGAFKPLLPLNAVKLRADALSIFSQGPLEGGRGVSAAGGVTANLLAPETPPRPPSRGDFGLNLTALLLPLGEMTVLERVIRLFQSVGVSDIRVIAGHRAADVTPLLESLGICGIFNEHYPEGMFSSVLAGIKSMSSDQEAFFLLPTDIPLVRRSTVLDLLAAYRRGQSDIVYPVFEGMRGHPPLISAKYIEDITHWQGQGGLRAFLEQHESAASDVETADEGILSDMDTPDDYNNILKRYDKYDIPTVRECAALMTKIFAVEEKIWRHCREVARVALCIGNALNAAACQTTAPGLDIDLIAAASLLHDLARKEPSHAAAGARILESMAYPVVAELVKTHIDIHIQEDKPIHESEILYIADKLVQGDRAVSIEEKFSEKIKRFSDNPEAKAAVERRFMNALKIKARFEKQTGKDLYAFLRVASGVQV